MYKRSEPIRLQHSVRTEYCFQSQSEMCPKFPKFPKFLKFVQSLGIIYLEILLNFDNYHVLEWKKNFEILGNFLVCKQTLDE